MNADAHRPDQTISSLVAAILSRWPLLAAAILVSLSLAVAYLHSASYRYTASYRVVPAQGQTGLSQGLGGLASLAGVDLSKDQQVPPYRLYLATLRGREIATELARDPAIMRGVFASEWDGRSRQWTLADDRSSFAGVLKKLLGVPQFPPAPPTAVRLEQHIQRNVSISEDAKDAIAFVSYNHPDPAFARYFLRSMHQATDRLLKRRALAKSAAYTAYLERRMPSITLVELRTALASEMAAQVKQAMMASSTAAYAADVLGDVDVSDRPTRPNVALVLILGVILGPFGVILTIAFGHFVAQGGAVRRH